jgi:2-hydroxy-3-keto-5-methylthiopentenyl-1-phosphate phosphatase
LINSPKPSRAPIPVFLYSNRKLRTTDDNFKTILACFEETDTDVDGVVSPSQITETLTKVITKIFGKDRVDSVKRFFEDENLDKITFKVGNKQLPKLT